METAILFFLFVPVLLLDPKSVNLNLETSVVLEPKDAKSNTSILHTVRKFLDDLQEVLDPKPKFRAQNDGIKFTDVLKDIAKILLNCSDEEINNLSKDLYRRVKKLETNDNDGFIARSLKQNLKNTLKSWTYNSPIEVRNCVRRYLNERGYFINYISNKLNNLFDEDDVKDIKTKLNAVTRSNNYEALNKILGDVVDNLINNKTNESNFVDNVNKEVIVAGRLKEEHSTKDYERVKLRENKEGKSNFKETSKEVILDKNIEVFVRAAD